MEWFRINDVYSYDIGIVVKELPSISLPSRSIETIKINGRDGNLHIDNKTYDVINKTIQCIVMNHSYIDRIKQVLSAPFGEIEFSNQPGKAYDFTIKNQVDFNVYLSFLNEFPLQLELQPFTKSEKITEVVTISKDIYIETGIETKPIIKVGGKGKFKINNVQIETLASDITIDCDLMLCFSNDLSMNNMVVLKTFPTLKNGINKIDLNGVSKLDIEYIARWL